MAEHKKVEALEGELKLLKAEVKESLVDVRQFLNSLKLPVAFKDLDGGGGDNQISLRGGLSLDSDGPDGPVARPPASPRQTRREQPAPPPQEPAPQPGRPDSVGMNKAMSWDKGTPRQQKPLPGPAPRQTEDMPVETPRPPEKLVQHMHLEKPADGPRDGEDRDNKEEGKEENMREDVVQSGAQVNLLANLIRWVSVARNEIGNDKLSTFLEIYATGGNLPPDLKAVILHLAEVIVPPSGDANTADVWSRLLLELHGILTGGGTSLRPLGTPAEKEAKEAPAPEDAKKDGPTAVSRDRTARLKLVVPDGENGEKEFDIEEFSVKVD